MSKKNIKGLIVALMIISIVLMSSFRANSDIEHPIFHKFIHIFI